MKDLQQHMNLFIQNEVLIKPHQKILLAISGGMDSVVLADLLIRIGYSVELAHVNFQLRGEESDRDEQFVRTLASNWQLPLHVTRVETEFFAAQHSMSIQEAARKIRYTWFQELLIQHHLDLIATAHHADDAVEGMLMNMFRGTGIKGLRGILPKQNKIIRPLLFASRQQIEAYANEHNLSFVEDSSNYSDKYTRNFLRLTILPQLKSIWPEVAENLRENMIRFRDTAQLYTECIERRIKKLVVEKDADIHVPIEGLRFQKPLKTIVFEVFASKGFSSGQNDEIIRLMDAQTGSFIDSSTHRIIKNRNWFICTPIEVVNPDLLLIDENTAEVNTAKIHLLIRTEQWTAGSPISSDPSWVQFDRTKIAFPLILRSWKAGDYFYPLGMTKKKKVARLLIDLKVPKNDKEKVLVLESEGRICWVVGYRMDDRFKIRPSTNAVLTLAIR